MAIYRTEQGTLYRDAPSQTSKDGTRGTSCARADLLVGFSFFRGGAASMRFADREFGRLKHEWALLPLRARGIERVRLHADLTILAKLACALARARAVPLAA